MLTKRAGPVPDQYRPRIGVCHWLTTQPYNKGYGCGHNCCSSQLSAKAAKSLKSTSPSASRSATRTASLASHSLAIISRSAQSTMQLSVRSLSGFRREGMHLVLDQSKAIATTQYSPFPLHPTSLIIHQTIIFPKKETPNDTNKSRQELPI